MHKLYAFLIFAFVLVSGRAQVVIHIESLSANTPEGASIFFAGNINGWNPGDPGYQLELRGDGDYWIVIPAGSGTVEFKFTRGSWASVESNGNGGFRPNRSFTYGNGDTLQLSILGWEDLDEGGGSQSTANEQVQIWDAQMYMPTLDRKRRIWVYLPQDYENSEKSYPVLYMHDGQNVFDASTSFAGEWQVDETLTRLEDEGHYGIIVVAIDNGGAHRLDEYSPFINPSYGGGEGDAYLDFIIGTLKPRVDSVFRTLPDAKHTGIMGSSMGGLISHYAHFRDPEVFGRAGIFSPSYWFSDQYYSYTESVGKTDSARLYLLAGAKENTIANGAQAMFDQLTGMGYSEQEVKLLIPSDGVHSEWFWAREFADAVKWLFPSDELLPTNVPSESPEIKIYPNPTRGNLQIEGQGQMDVRIFDWQGRLFKQSTVNKSGEMDLSQAVRNRKYFLWVRQGAEESIRKLLIL